MTDLLLAVHVLAAVVLVGSATRAHVELSRLRRLAPERLGAAFGDVDWYGTRIILPAALILVASGFGVAGARELSVSELWLAVPLAIWIVAALLDMGVLTPLAGRLRGEAAAERADLVARYLVVARVQLALLLLAVVVMVTKPGA